MQRPGNRCGIFLVVVLVGLGLSGASPAASGDRCDVELNAKLTTQERTGDVVRMEFEVDLAAAPECTAVSYDLIVEEMLPNRQWKSVRKARHVELSDSGSAIDLIEHVMSADLELLGQRTQVVGCECRAAAEDTNDSDPS